MRTRIGKDSPVVCLAKCANADGSKIDLVCNHLFSVSAQSVITSLRTVYFDKMVSYYLAIVHFLNTFRSTSPQHETVKSQIMLLGP